ncbi:MAG: response regulator [Prevotella sp.]|nr:response regulator [Prevotella sp.]
MLFRRSIVLLCLGLLLSVKAFAVFDYVRFRNLTVEDGLPSNTVRNIAQDKDGFIWMGTDNGLCRYDGVSFRLFRNLENGVNQYVSCLLAVESGLYVGTDNGAFFFDFVSESFRRIIPSVKGGISSFAADKEGNVWVTMIRDSIYCYLPESDQFLAYKSPVNRNFVSKVFVDLNNQVWFYTNSSQYMLYRFNKATEQFQFVKTDMPDADAGCYAMTQTTDGRFWIGTWNGGLYLLDDNDHVEQFFNPRLSMVGSHIHQLSELPNHHLLISCDEGLIDFNPQDRSWVLISDPEHSEAINNRFVYSSFADNEGGLWFSTFYGGVNYLSPVSERFVSFQNREGLQGLRGSVVARFCEDSRGRIWIASDDGGLNCFKSGKSDTFLDFPNRQQLQRYNIHAFCIDGENLWIGTFADGVFCMDVNSGRMVHYTIKEGLADDNSYALYRDSEGRIWAATMQGVCFFNREQSKFQVVKLLGALTIDIDEDPQGNLWFSTQGGGLWRYQPKKNIWKNYVHQPNDTTSLPSNQVNCVAISSDHRLWVGTESGLCFYDASSDSFIPQSLDAPSNDVRGIIEDGQYLWFSTAKGIVRYNKERDVLIFNKYDGLVSEQFQPNSCLKASDGRIYFGSVRGFNAFYPYHIRVNSMPPKVFITGLKIYNKEVKVGEKPLTSSLSHLDELNLSYRDNMFSLSFASLSYCSPEKNQYAYMLEGFDKSWNYSGSRNEASYTNVPSGTYTFRVRATNNDGVWSTDEAQLKIVVHPPFWLSWPAKILYLLLALLAIYGYTQFRLRKAEQRHQKELKDINDQAEADVRDARLHFFTMIAHEIRTPVSLIIGPLETLKQKPGWNESLNIIDRNAHRLLTLVNQLLDFNKVQQEGFSMNFSSHLIAPVIQAVAERFEPTLNQNNITFQVEYPDENFSAVFDDEGLTKVVSNLMANAAKYTHDRILLSCEVDPDNQYFRIIVEDNGLGISKEDRKRIFDAFYQARDNKPGTGIGLSIVKTIVDQHHGDVSVESEEGKGARFVVTLPVSQDDGETSSVNLSDKKTTNGEIRNVAPVIPDETEGTSVVLIVEDDADMLSFLASHFANDYTVLTAANGVEGLRQLSQNTVTLIVSDWMMPEMDGAEFCRRVRDDRNTSHIPLIMLTAKTDDDSKTLGMNIGADAYIEKPFSLKFLDATIRNLINRRRELMRRFSQSPDEPISPLATNEVDDEFLTRMNSIIEENISNSELSVGFLAEQMNMSRSGLFAKIKSIADVTPNEMIQIVRLKRAAQLISEGKYRISEVSYMVGFSSPSYFSKCFQKQFGKKPGEFSK